MAASDSSTTAATGSASCITVGLLQENCWLIVDSASRDAVLVDPGDEAPRILRAVREEGAKLRAIWLTHGHCDHVGAIAEILSDLQIPVYMHPADLPLYDRSAEVGALYGMSFIQPPRPDHELAEGDVVECGSLRFEVLHVPGHSPGQVAFVGHDLCISGDVLFAGSIGRTDLPLSNPRDMSNSLRRLATLPGRTRVLPGHGSETTVQRELAANPFLQQVN